MNKKKFSKDKCITTLLEILSLKDEVLYITDYKGKDIVIHIDALYNMTFRTVVDLITDRKLYTTKIVVDTSVPKPIKDLIVKTKVTHSKTNLNDIYK